MCQGGGGGHFRDFSIILTRIRLCFISVMSAATIQLPAIQFYSILFNTILYPLQRD
jgi:hypothetical protein